MAADGYSVDWLEAEQRDGGRAHVMALLAELKTTHAIHGQRVLELGSGLGGNLRVLAPGNRVQGIEALALAAEAASARGIPTRRADLEQGPLDADGACWDWVLMLDVLEHLVHPERVLAEARRLLAPGGRIVVNVPNSFDWRSRCRLLRGAGIDATGYFPGEPVWRYPHLRFFRHADLMSLLQATGFELESDLSGRQPSVPKARWWPRLSRRLAARWPDLAASGFFVIARVRSLPSTPTAQ
jgi:SAM-dependent methyltransferase